MKTVVITGGNGDIAKAIANLLKEKKYNVLLPTRKELDVTDLISIKNYFDQLKVDILINNAGAIYLKEIEHNDILQHKNVIDVNLTGTFACTGEVLRKNKNAQIINIGSSAGTKVHGGWSSYCASKAAVIMATRCWADEGIDTICISPGRALTKMRKSMYPNEDPNTLLNVNDFAQIVYKAVIHKYANGINLDVNVNNVGDLINEQ